MRFLPAGMLFIWIFTLKTQTQATPLTKLFGLSKATLPHENKTPGTQQLCPSKFSSKLYLKKKRLESTLGFYLTLVFT